MEIKEEKSADIKHRLWKIRDLCHRDYLSWAGYDLIDVEVLKILKGLFGEDWRI